MIQPLFLYYKDFLFWYYWAENLRMFFPAAWSQSQQRSNIESSSKVHILKFQFIKKKKSFENI